VFAPSPSDAVGLARWLIDDLSELEEATEPLACFLDDTDGVEVWDDAAEGGDPGVRVDGGPRPPCSGPVHGNRCRRPAR
jgi:hypothetical protein